ncbi:hypothetical protein PQX77_010558 [Marasmius sp. AFHP31]|nr:hypothetical protein PQX77_010558 [Marasmius sp. AFHP31]
MLIDVKAPNGPSVLQTPEIAVPSLTSSHLQQQGIFDCDKLPADIERLPPVVDVTLRPDPYNLKNGLKSEEQLSSLRLKKRGKRLVEYQEKQNTASPSILLLNTA